MEWATTLVLMFGGLIALLAIRLPVAFAFLLVNIAGAWLVFGGEMGMIQLVRNAVTSLSSFTLVPIPLFVLMGAIIFHSGVAQRAIGAIDVAIHKVPARLSVVTVAAGTVFAALSGSSIANAALLGKTMLPEMLKRGYHPTLAMGPIMASGAIAILIPPSALAVLLGSLAKISISKLLVAGIVPAIIMACGFLFVIMYQAVRYPDRCPTEAPLDLPFRERFLPLIRDVLPLSFVLVAVVGSLLAGIATPTESAAFGCIAAALICTCYRSFSLEVMRKAIFETVALSTTILFIVVASQTFSQILSFSGATQQIVTYVSNSSAGPMIILLGIIGMLLVLGCFVDQISMMLLTIPLVFPIAQSAGIDPIVLGTTYLLALEIALLTPPFGLLLFVMKSAAPAHISTGDVYRAVLPFLSVKLAVLALVVALPGLVLWLPNLIG